MANWEIIYKGQVVKSSDTDSIEYEFPENNTGTEKIYTINYTSDTETITSSTYSVPAGDCGCGIKINSFRANAIAITDIRITYGMRYMSIGDFKFYLKVNDDNEQEVAINSSEYFKDPFRNTLALKKDILLTDIGFPELEINDTITLIVSPKNNGCPDSFRRESATTISDSGIYNIQGKINYQDTGISFYYEFTPILQDFKAMFNDFGEEWMVKYVYAKDLANLQYNRANCLIDGTPATEGQDKYVELAEGIYNKEASESAYRTADINDLADNTFVQLNDTKLYDGEDHIFSIPMETGHERKVKVVFSFYKGTPIDE